MCIRDSLYNLVTEILVDGVVTDRYESRFGFRWTEFTVNDGFLLNGEWMKPVSYTHLDVYKRQDHVARAADG